jgi:2-polyprenyl-6-methoxyphenol hydroxylase-like FAD-dependent oxidoreductase
MKVLIVGAAPAGLSFAALMAHADSSHEITVIEKNASNIRPGFGITLRSDGISLLGLDSMDIFQHLEGRAFRFRGEAVVDLPYPPSAHGITLSRAALVNALIGICTRSGVRIHFGNNVAELRESDFEQFDLVVPPHDSCLGRQRTSPDRPGRVWRRNRLQNRF